MSTALQKIVPKVRRLLIHVIDVVCDADVQRFQEVIV